MTRSLRYLLLFFVVSLLSSTVEGRDHHFCKKNNKTLFSATYVNLIDLSITGTGNVSQEVANITQGTKVLEDPIPFNSSTSSIVFPNPLVQIPAEEGDTIFVTLSFSLDPGSSVVSSQPLIVITSDRKNFSTPQTTSLLEPGVILSNTSAVTVGTDLFGFFTVFPE